MQSNTSGTSATPPRSGYSPREVAQRLGIPYRQVLRLCASGAIRSVRAGHYRVIPVAALDEFLAGAGADA